MKRFFLSLLLGFAVTASAHAQSFEFETLRTPEVPGFFMVRIFAGENNIPLPVQNVFVKNYTEDEESSYSDLIPFIEEFGGKIIGPQSLSENIQSEYNRIVFLGGEPREGFLHFVAPENDQALEEFSTFARENLGPIFLKDIKPLFGGNVSEVFPESHDTLSTEPVYFVGKFEKDMKTRMQIESISSEGTLIASAPLHLEDAELARGTLAKELPYIWEEFWKAAHPSETETKGIGWRLSTADLFPGVMLLLGLVILYRIIVEVRRRRKDQEEFENSLKHNQNPQNWEKGFTPPSSPEEDLPFSVEKKR